MEILLGIVVAVITTGGTIANTLVAQHYSKKNNLDDVKKAIEELKKTSEAKDSEIENKFRGIALMYAKTYLIDFMSRIEKGEVMNDEQIRLLYELKETYNKAGGDSYVDDMFDKLKNKEKI